MRALRAAAVLALIVLSGRALAYALTGSPLEHAAGGPALPLVILVSAALALALSSAILWLAALGVSERRLLERRPLAREPRLRLPRLVPRAVGWFVLSALAFALLESVLHWRAGLGWHGLDCLLGPVHRDALPILAALSTLATACGAALAHVVAWMRRTLAALRGARRRARRPRVATRFAYEVLSGRLHGRSLGARAPPLVVA